MHDGASASLKEILDFYIGGGNARPNLDKEIRPLDSLTGQERRDLLAFLNSLTGDIPSEERGLIVRTSAAKSNNSSANQETATHF